MLLLLSLQASSLECITEQYFSYFSRKKYTVDTQMNRLNEKQSPMG